MQKFGDKQRCGAWRCKGFACSNYNEISYDCNNNLCHVCNSGHSCQNCEDYTECECGVENAELQAKALEERRAGA